MCARLIARGNEAGPEEGAEDEGPGMQETRFCSILNSVGKAEFGEDSAGMNDKGRRTTRARISIADMLKGNEKIEAAIRAYYRNRTNQNISAVMEAVRQELEPGTRVLMAAAPAAKVVDFKDPQKKQQRFVLNRLKAPDGKEAAFCFTSESEQKKRGNTPALAMPIREALELVKKNGALQGLLINPWGERFLLPQASIAAILQAEEARLTGKPVQPARSRIFIQKGDITELPVECIVSAADTALSSKDGVSAVISAKAGPALAEKLAAAGGLAAGDALLTAGYGLKAAHIIHTAGPLYPAEGTKEEKSEAASMLLRCYLRALDLAAGNGIHSIAFPAISTGGNAYPMKEAVPVAMSAATQWLSAHQNYLMQVVMCAADEAAYAEYQSFMQTVHQVSEEAANRRAAQEAARVSLRSPAEDLTLAAVMGFVVGDALGVPAELRTREELAAEPVTGLSGGGRHHREAGIWSDGSSMTLAELDSLSGPKAPDMRDMMEKFFRFRMFGDYTADGEMFDIGETSDSAIMNYARGTAPRDCGIDDVQANGSGSLARMLPFALLLCRPGHPFCTDEDRALLHEASALTHAHARSKAACELYALILRNLVTHIPREKLAGHIQDAVNETLLFYRYGEDAEDEEEQKAIASHREAVPSYDAVRAELGAYERLADIAAFGALPEAEIRSSGYVVDTLEAAVWCLLNTDSYRDCVLKAVNLGGGTDKTAAVAGGLAGAFYGAQSIPEEWRSGIARGAWIEELCAAYQKRWFTPLSGTRR